MGESTYQVAILRAYAEIEDVVAFSEEEAIAKMVKKDWCLGIDSSMQKDLNKAD